MGIGSRRLMRAYTEVTTVTTPTAVTFTPAAIALSAPELANSGRGQIRWLDAPPAPSTWPVPDVYERDHLKWSLLEPSPGVYDMTLLEAGMQKAVARGGRYSFRVMAWYPDHPSRELLPSWIPDIGDGYLTPDWNSEVFLSSWEGLMAALGRYAADDPRLFAVDYGGYGSCGEWLAFTNSDHGKTNYYGQAEITLANAQRMIAAVNNAFPNKPKLMNWTSGSYGGWPEVACGSGNDRVGVRCDNVGCADMPFLTQTPEAQSSWQRVPAFGEWGITAATWSGAMGLKNVRDFHFSLLSSGNFPIPYDNMSATDRDNFIAANKATGYRYSLTSLSMQTDLTAGASVPVTTEWINVNVAPTNDDWKTELVLTSPAGTEWTMPLTDDLRTLHGNNSTATFTSTVTIPGSVPAGSYTAGIRIIDQTEYLPPMNLATAGRTAKGVYDLGTITVTQSNAGPVDTTPPPTPVITSPATATTSPFTIQGTCEPNARITVNVNGKPHKTTANASGAWSVSVTNIGTIGQYSTVSVIARDSVGNTSTAATQSVMFAHPTQLGTDNFDRANASSLGVSSAGQTWVTTGNWTVANNQAVPGTGENTALIDAGHADTHAAVDLSGFAANAWPGILTRYQDTDNYYLVEVDEANNRINLLRRSGGTNTLLSQFTATPALAATTRLAVTARAISGGVAISIIANGKLLLQKADITSTAPSGTRVGLKCGNFAASPPTFDNFACTRA